MRISVVAYWLFERRITMAGEFGKFIDEKRRGHGPDGGDILLKDIAKAMGATPTYPPICLTLSRDAGIRLKYPCF